MEFSFFLPTRIVFGCKAIQRVGTLAKEEGAAFAQKNDVDFLVAVGGGSSMDTGKAIAGMLGHHTTDFSVIQYPNEYTQESYPLICIPTTAGTGSEVSTCGVVTDEKTKTKVFCFDPRCHARIAVCDPEVLMGVPEKIAAATALDALTHAIEGFVAKCTNPVTECYGIRAVKLISENIRDYVYNRNAKNCEAVMLGSLFAGISFGYSEFYEFPEPAKRKEFSGSFSRLTHYLLNALLKSIYQAFHLLPYSNILLVH